MTFIIGVFLALCAVYGPALVPEKPELGFVIFTVGCLGGVWSLSLFKE